MTSGNASFSRCCAPPSNAPDQPVEATGRVRPAHAARTLAGLVAFSVIMTLALVTSASPDRRLPSRVWQSPVISDTDSVQVDLPSALDSIRAADDEISRPTRAVRADTDSVAVPQNRRRLGASDRRGEIEDVRTDRPNLSEDSLENAVGELLGADSLSVAADTDDVALVDQLRRVVARMAIDSLGTDSLRAALDRFGVRKLERDSIRTVLVYVGLDSLARFYGVLPDTGRAAFYMPRWRTDAYIARPFSRAQRPFVPKIGNYWSHAIEVDTLSLTFRSREKVGNQDVRYPRIMPFDTYRQLKLEDDLASTWHDLVLQRSRQMDQQRRGGLGFNIVVPGGRQSAFTTIFGKPEVDLRVNGQADIKAGFDYRKSDQQVAVTGRPSQLDPDFKQDLRLGITGTIGDKLRIDVNYDSQNQFDYQNQLKLVYTGYEDEIIQSIEAGNVFLQTPSTLIRGGQSLFGIKSEFQLGGVRLTTVMSQQEGQSNSLNIEGGSEATEFDLKPTDYDDNVHFFLAYYFRNRFEEALVDPPNIRVANAFERITELEVWRLMPTTPEEQNVRQVVAMVDLGESPQLLSQADLFADQQLPANSIDQYSDVDGGEVDTELRNGAATPGSYLETNKELGSADYQVGKFKRLERGRDYEIDEVLGYISLRQRLQESEAIAVSFRYTAGGRTYQVGDFSTETGGSDGGQNEDKLVLKLIRPVQLRQPAPESDFNPAAWYLEMRNIYKLPAGGITAADFELQIYYEPPGTTASKTLPGVGGQSTLLQLLGLDRVNANQALRPDDQFDFLVNYTIDPGRGTLIFPYLEPFGKRVESVILEGGSPDAEEQNSLYVFDNLYQQKKANARRDSQHDVYRVRGAYKGSVQDFYDLRAYAGLVPGSVRVTSGGTPLQENSDFIVDYQGGTVTITNQAFLSSGRQIDIEYEQNSFFNLQKKTLLGMRADYELGQRLALGATVMRLTQKSPIDKFRIGEEPVSNTIWGIDGQFRSEPRWLTRAVDALPLIQTKEPSKFQLTGEFAQLRPNHVETIAFDRTRRNLLDEGRDFESDELAGISFIDDFEGFENTYSLMQPGSWSLAAAPDSVAAIDRSGPRAGSFADSLRTTWRGTFAWYRINANMLQEVSPVAYDPEAIVPLRINDVFPNRDAQAELVDQIETLDFYFNPSERGPYNYTTELPDFMSNPKQVWGGMSQRLPEGFTDFSLKNIDFVEFVFRPFPENAPKDAGRDAKLYVDLGSISEDILPNEKLNNEDGLSIATVSDGGITTWGRLPSATQNSVVDIDAASDRTEDLGLDGLASYGGQYPPQATEQVHFERFLSSLPSGSSDPKVRAEVAKALIDPSGDDYHYFANDRYYGDPQYYPGGATFQQRFSRYFSGYELNAFETQNKIADNTSIKRGNSRFPDSEDINLNSTVDTDNSYFQYELSLSKPVLDSLSAPGRVDDYIVGEITDREGNGTGWYQARIPVQEFTRRVGAIQDFSLIESIRVWTTGHEVPITLRFATLELVGSQWQKSERITLERETPSDTLAAGTRLTISSINNEENADTYRSPFGAIVSQTRLATGRVQNAREQSLVVRTENLAPTQQRAIFKTQNQSLDLLKYSNLRMFVHMHGETGDGTDLSTLPPEEGREKARLFIRLGANESNDYYEYEQPLTPSAETAGNPDVLWQTFTEFGGEVLDLNSVNVKLAALNQLKVARDRLAFPTDSVFYNVRGDTLSAPDAPDAELFAPPGTRLGIRGNPSLGKVNSIVIGVRNAADSTSTSFSDTIEDMTVWINELRVAGYDETNGWAGLANLDIQLADFGRIKANIKTQTDGFGSLSSTLGEREQNSISNWSVTSEVNLDKFVPERFGWTVPVNYQVQQNTTTPRFAPTRGDVRLEELLSQIDARTDLEDTEKADLRRETTEAAQTRSFTRSITTRIGKQGSSNRVLRNTLDGLSLNYSRSSSESRSPSQVLNDNWRWTSTVSYRFATRRPRTVRPLWFLEPIPLIRALGTIRFSYLPNSISTSGTLNRTLSQTRERPIVAPTDTSSVPLEIRFPMREQHAFGHSRNFQLQYNPFSFLNLSFDTNTSQNLNSAGADTLYNTLTADSIYAGFRIADALAGGLIDSTGLASTYEQELLIVKPFDQVMREVFSGAAEVRTEQHGQNFTASFRPQLNRIRWLDWVQLQDISYRATFAWQNGPIGRKTGAGVRNNVDYRAGVGFRIQELFRKLGPYKAIETAEENYQSDREAKKATRKAWKTQRKEERRLRREEERAAKEAREAAIAAGEILPEDEVTEGEVMPEEAAPEEELPEEEAPEEEAPEGEEGIPAEERPADEMPLPAEEEARPVRDDITPLEDIVQESVEQERPGRVLPFPGPISLVRQIILSATGLRDFSISYTGTRSSTSSNVGTAVLGTDSTLQDVKTYYSLLDAFQGRGTSLRYRFGLDRQFDIANRIIDPSLQVSDVLQDANRFQGRTSLNPTQTLQINLNWSLDWSDGQTFTFRPISDDLGNLIGVDTTITRNGNNKASVWAFGASYLDMFQSQLGTYLADYEAAFVDETEPEVIGDDNGDGRVALSSESVVEDFRNSFIGGGRTLDDLALLPIPKPTWTLTYSGLSSWPIIRALTRSVTLRHGYSADYTADFSTNTAFGGADSVNVLDIGPKRIVSSIPEFQTGSIRINERYQPLVGLDISWKGSIQTNLSMNRSNAFSLSTSNFEVSENRTSELSFTASWQKQGMKLPFLKRINNRINLSVTVSQSTTEDQRLRLRRALESAITDPEFVLEDALTGDNISLVTAHKRTTIAPQIAYQFSNRVSANFTLRYEQFDSEDSRQPSSTNIQGNFNIRVSIAN